MTNYILTKATLFHCKVHWCKSDLLLPESVVVME